MESLADLKELRENAEVNQETAAEWIGVVRSTYTRKEKGDLPTAFAEYALVKLKLELILESKKEVMPPCGILDSERVEDICRNVGVIYKSGSQPAINSLVCHIENLVSMLVGRSQVTEIIDRLNTIQKDITAIKGERKGYHDRLDRIEELLKIEGSDEKPVVEIQAEETAAR